MTEQLTEEAWYQQIIEDTKSMTQEERWAFYDLHPGSQEVVRKFRNQNAARLELQRSQKAQAALSLEAQVAEIDAATANLDPEQFVTWLENHPEAKAILMQINEQADQQ